MSDNEIVEVKISLLDKPKQYLRLYDNDPDLVESIKEYGQVTAITVRHIGKNRYRVIDGWRRVNALKSLGYDTVQCIIAEIEKL